MLDGIHGGRTEWMRPLGFANAKNYESIEIGAEVAGDSRFYAGLREINLHQCRLDNNEHLIKSNIYRKVLPDGGDTNCDNRFSFW